MNRDFDGLITFPNREKRNFFNFAFYTRNCKSTRRSFGVVKPSLIVR